MEYIICCACSLLCFVCGLLAARGLVRDAHRTPPPDTDWLEHDDALSRDIAAMLAYTGPKKEEDAHEDS